MTSTSNNESSPPVSATEAVVSGAITKSISATDFQAYLDYLLYYRTLFALTGVHIPYNIIVVMSKTGIWNSFLKILADDKLKNDARIAKFKAQHPAEEDKDKENDNKQEEEVDEEEEEEEEEEEDDSGNDNDDDNDDDDDDEEEDDEDIEENNQCGVTKKTIKTPNIIHKDASMQTILTIPTNININVRGKTTTLDPSCSTK